MITHAKKIKNINKTKPKITLKKVFQGYKTRTQKDKNKKKNKSKY